MDFSNFKLHDWLMVGGGAAMLILGFALDWSSYHGVTGDNPFDYLFTGGIAWLLVVAVGVLAFMRAIGKLPDTQPWPLIFLGATGLAVLLMLLRIILGGRNVGGIGLSRGNGMYGALVWSAISAAGAYLFFTASGGTLDDLKDLEKIKKSFGAGSSEADANPPPPDPPPPSDPPPTPPTPPSP
jgi:hypothetical protein